jgi:hypothetical protein
MLKRTGLSSLSSTYFLKSSCTLKIWLQLEQQLAHVHICALRICTLMARVHHTVESHAQMYICVHTCMHTYVHTHILACIQAYIHTYTHTHVRTACVNQDQPNPAEQLNGTLGQIIGCCDLMVTPIHDPDWKTWALEPFNDSNGNFQPYIYIYIYI